MNSLRLSAFLLLAWSQSFVALARDCDVCSETMEGTVFTFTDKVDQDKRWVCETCADLTTMCYRCGVPVLKGYLTLSDGRILCPRDRVGVVMDERDALAICRDVDGTLESMLGRFTTFPATNVQIRLADRVDVRALVGVAGYDFSCPNLLGYTLSLQKPAYQLHDIRLLTGLQKGVLQATYAHELAHAWISENVVKARELELKGNAAEGFCELIGYLVAEAYRDETAKKHIVGNQYTRGQALLFIETERRFGVGDVIDWMQYGQTDLLRVDQVGDIRDVEMPAGPASRPVSEILFIPNSSPKSWDALELTSITVGPRVSIATINGRALEVGEDRKVPLGGSNVVLRCLEIDQNHVLVEYVGSTKRERLTLGKSDKSEAESSPGPADSNL